MLISVDMSAAHLVASHASAGGKEMVRFEGRGFITEGSWALGANGHSMHLNGCNNEIKVNTAKSRQAPYSTLYAECGTGPWFSTCMWPGYTETLCWTAVSYRAISALTP